MKGVNASYLATLGRNDPLDFDAAGVDRPECVPQRNLPPDRFKPCPFRLARRIGNRYAFECRMLFTYAGRESKHCGVPLTISAALQGFVADRGNANQDNETKAALLTALEDGELRTASQLVEATGLSVGQVNGALARLTRRLYVQRSEERVMQAIGSAHVYEISERGYRWLDWYEAQHAPA